MRKFKVTLIALLLLLIPPTALATWDTNRLYISQENYVGNGLILGHRKKINIRDGLQAIPESRLDFV